MEKKLSFRINSKLLVLVCYVHFEFFRKFRNIPLQLLIFSTYLYENFPKKFLDAAEKNYEIEGNLMISASIVSN